MTKRIVGPTGEVLQPHQLRALIWLSGFPDGSGGVAGVMSGGVLAALVSLGLADRAPRGRVGGGQWIVNAAGRALLAREGVRS